MGLNLKLVACKVSRKRISDDIISIMNNKKFKFKKVDNAKSLTEDDDTFDITKEFNNWTLAFCPNNIDNKFVIELSKSLTLPLFEFGICEGEFWYYRLFVKGKLVNQYSPLPNYFGGIKYFNKKKWKANPNLLNSLFNVSIQKIESYLTFWEDNDISYTKKAFTKDKFSIKNEWNMVDFQEKLGIIYPDFEKPKTVDMWELKFYR